MRPARFLTALMIESFSISVSVWGGHKVGTNCWRYSTHVDVNRFASESSTILPSRSNMRRYST